MGSVPLSQALGVELAKWPREDPSTGQSGSRRWHSHSRGRDRWRQCQSPLPQHPSRHQLPSPSPPNHVLLTGGSAAPLRISTYTQDHKNLRAGHGEVTPPHILKSILLHKNLWRSTCLNNAWRNWSGLMWMRSWAMILHCPQTWPPS